jgi:hypothetical protein
MFILDAKDGMAWMDRAMGHMKGMGREQKEIDRYASRQNRMELEAFCLLYYFCTRKEEHCHYWFLVSGIGELELLCVVFKFL